MAFRIRYHEDALSDLEEVLAWSRERHRDTTEQFANDLLNRLEMLEALPYLGAPIRGNRQLRRLLHAPLYIYYRIDSIRESIEVLHIRHASRREPALGAG
jgi:plasmid stabilization system protein ParE